MSYEVLIGFAGGRTETAVVEDEKRGLELSNALMTKSGGPGNWFPIRPDADGNRLAVRYSGDGPVQSIRLRKATNGDAAIVAPEPAPEPPAPESPTPEPIRAIGDPPTAH